LAHQVKLAAWPTAEDDSAIHAEGLTARAAGRTLFEDLALTVPRGGVLVVEGEHAQRLALLFGLTGRVRFTAGEAKVLGHVLPEEASLIRRRTLVLQPADPRFEASLREVAEGGRRGFSDGIVLVDAADELSDAQDAALRDALTASVGRPITWVLGGMPGTDPEALVSRPAELLRLAPHLALAGQEGHR